MVEHFKKGQMVPKRLGVVFTHKKNQSNVTFGCDVEVDGRMVRATSPTERGVICINGYKGRRRGNGTFQRVNYAFVGFQIDPNNSHAGAALEVKS
ncbi:hypothetical protein KMC53_gp58 [Klebsiella phage LASTA]|uniref:Uncharacterized protein n=2 Tax=Lastavirus lasta TaxID=2845090 RepID=A0A6H0X3F9_9CAUD|nr:hypothetical protein KMC53_gp58 [Klebsiella phage LASTA]QIW86685.1 hypothetical protein 24149LASTA_00058 [Klebsiella phage LASTA]QIW86761.1 hypothetical protein 24147SJM3_00058 [Klebsiella phage SJM3]